MLDKLYSYQKECLTKINEIDKGIVIMPTGTGKTFVQAAVIVGDILNNKNQFRLYVINSPKIILSFQLLLEVYSFLIKSNIDSRYYLVHSGGDADIKDLEEIRTKSSENNIAYSEINSGTSVDGIVEIMRKAKLENKPCVLFSTYHSADRIESARKKFDEDKLIDAVCNDEAHHLIEERFFKLIDVLNTKRLYFFTATLRYTKSKESRGMNNINAYGNIIYSMPPRKAIELGKMVRPRIHILKSRKVISEEDYLKSIPFIIRDAYLSHFEILINTFKNNEYRILMNPKLLITVKGSKDILAFKNSIQYDALLKSDVGIFITHTADDLGNFVNDKKVSRVLFLKELKRYGNDPTKRMIVLHYDILTEGVDVSGFSGVLLLRNLKKFKLLQTIGRCARLEKNDRVALNKNKATPLKKLNKPYTYVIMPNITYDDKDSIIINNTLIKELRSNNTVLADDYIITDKANGIPDEDELENLIQLVLFMKSEDKVGRLTTELEKENSIYANGDEYETINSVFPEMEKLLKIEKETEDLNNEVLNRETRSPNKQLDDMDGMF